MNFLKDIIFASLIGLHYCLPSETIVRNEEVIPFIIGISLMAFVIIILLAVVLLCFCMKRNLKKKNAKYGVIDKNPESIKLINMKERSISALKNNKVSPVLEPEKKIRRPQSDIEVIAKPSIQLPKIKRYRRASVPSVLSVLYEASPSLEASRKMSLSYNCVLEPLNDSRKKGNIVKDDIGFPESGLSTEIYSLIQSDEKVIIKSPKKYSVYEDEFLSYDEFYSKHGKIVFSLQYNLGARILEVTVKKAQYLSGHRVKGQNHFYVKIRLRQPDESKYASNLSLQGVPHKGSSKPVQNVKGTFRTMIQSDFCNPVFEETFKFTNVTATVLKECVLQFIVKEETPKFMERNIVIGQVNFQLSDAELIDKHELITELIRDILPANPTDSKGQAVVSLYYNRSLGILSVSILEIIPGIEALIDVSIELCLRSFDSVIISKKLLLPENLKSNRVIEMSVDNCLMNSFCLIILVFSRIRNCPKTPYGRLVIGPIRFSDGPAMMHWAEMSIGDRLVTKTHEIL